jgi:threonine synthase
MRNEKAFQECINPGCGAQFDCAQIMFNCPTCGDLLDVVYDWDKIEVPSKLSNFEKRWQTRSNPLDLSGVWRFRELLGFCDDEFKVSIGEGQTILQQNDTLAELLGMKRERLFLQYEGLNPTGSFKDNGMTAAFSHAKLAGAKSCACASTGNTSASMAMYAHFCNMEATVFIGSGKIAFGKLSQAMDYGGHTIQIQGDFDDCMKQVQDVCRQLGIYLVNSLNPFRLEGQKTTMYRVLEQLNWRLPDWIIVPGGNLGNSSAFGKAFAELKELGLIEKTPRLAVINAVGANTLAELFNDKELRWNDGKVDQSVVDDYYANLTASNYRANTCASAIEISRPVNLKKCLRALEVCNGVVLAVEDSEIVDAKAQIGMHGFGCEPASAATVAGLKRLLADKTIGPDETVVCILTGHALKDPNLTVNYHKEKQGPFSNPPIEVANDLEEIIRAMKK